MFLLVALQPVVHADFIHPGILHTQSDFDRMREKVAANAEPWKGSWDKLVASPYAQLGWTPRPDATIIRGGTGDNVAVLYKDVAAAYQHALRWKISGDTAHGDKARDILNAWSATLTTLSGNADRYLAAGIFGYQFANAAEMMRGYSGFDLARFKTMMLTVFYPLNDRFLREHNDACITNYWANWDLCNMASILAIAILCDDIPKFERAIDYFKTGGGNGSINRAVWYLHSPVLGQWQESGRDQAHTILGVGLMGAFCEIAWNQGRDLYVWNNNRFMAGAEYVAQYNLGSSVPFVTYTWGTGQNCAQRSQTVISEASRGENRPCWELIYHHYASRRKLSVPNITGYATRLRPEGGPGGHPTTFDQPGFGSLTFARDPSGAVPAGTYRPRNRASGKILDTLGATANGAVVSQSARSGDTSQRWVLSYVGAYAKLMCGAGGKYLDSVGRTANDSTVGQWENNPSPNQQWTIQDIGGGYYKIINRANGLCLAADGATMEFQSTGASHSQQWQFVGP